MKKWIWTILILTTMMALISCDIVYYVGINNFGQPGRVVVAYDNSQKSAWFDSDTLIATRFDGSDDSLIIRTNIDSTSYSFIAPTHYQVELMPKSLGTPIREVTFETANDSIITVDFYGNERKLLKRQGIIETKGFYFTNTILINKK